MFATIILLLIIVATLFAALIFANKGAAAVTKIRPSGGSYKAVPELRTAHSLLTWLSVAGWISIALVITGIVLFFIYGGEFAAEAEASQSVVQGSQKKSSFMTDAIIFGTAGIVLIIGFIGVLAARDINRAAKNPDNGIDRNSSAFQKAYHDAIMAASLGIGVIGLSQ